MVAHTHTITKAASKVTAKHFANALASVRASTDSETQRYYENLFREMKTAISKKSKDDLGLGYYR